MRYKSVENNTILSNGLFSPKRTKLLKSYNPTGRNFLKVSIVVGSEFEGHFLTSSVIDFYKSQTTTTRRPAWCSELNILASRRGLGFES